MRYVAHRYQAVHYRKITSVLKNQAFVFCRRDTENRRFTKKTRSPTCLASQNRENIEIYMPREFNHEWREKATSDLLVSDRVTFRKIRNFYR